MEQQQVFDVLASERAYQDRKWGSIDQHPHEVGGWLMLMHVHLRKAQEAWASSGDDYAALLALRKVLAVGVACMEQHGAPRRDTTQPVSRKMRATDPSMGPNTALSGAAEE